jgi:hypothetical protein
MARLAIECAGGLALPGEAYLAETPLLRLHAGTQPDLFLRWNTVPLSANSIDVIVHLHGFSQQGAEMLLSEKVSRSGLDLSRRKRPALALLPRGNWIRHYYYDFPALLASGIDVLVDYGIEQFARALPAGTALRLHRFILSAHSGGVTPALDIIAEAMRPPDELYLFDGLYGRDPRLGEPPRDLPIVDRWLGDRLAHEPGSPGALRIVYIERQTGPLSRDVAELIGNRLARADPAFAADLARRYRVERSGVPHGYIADRCLPELLADPAAEFDWSRV